MPPLPVRQLSRFSGEFHLSGIEALVRLLPEAGDADVVALAMLRVCLNDWAGDDYIRAPLLLKRAATLRSLTRSLDRPAATVHGLIRRLVDCGVTMRGPEGLYVSPAAAPCIVAFLETLHDLVLRLAHDMCGTGALSVTGAAGRTCPIRSVLAVGLDMMLMPFETFRDEIGDWTSKKLWIVISTLAVRRITCNSELSERYAVSSTPDAERRAVPAAQVRAVTRTSTATAWRRLKTMEAAGVLSQRDGGWLVRSTQLLEADLEAGVRAAMDYYLRRLKELVTAGMDPANPRYLRDRPPLVARDWTGD